MATINQKTFLLHNTIIRSIIRSPNFVLNHDFLLKVGYRWVVYVILN